MLWVWLLHSPNTLVWVLQPKEEKPHSIWNHSPIPHLLSSGKQGTKPHTGSPALEGIYQLRAQNQLFPQTFDSAQAESATQTEPPWAYWLNKTIQIYCSQMKLFKPEPSNLSSAQRWLKGSSAHCYYPWRQSCWLWAWIFKNTSEKSILWLEMLLRTYPLRTLET